MGLQPLDSAMQFNISMSLQRAIQSSAAATSGVPDAFSGA
jgi:hypothetical protein